MAYSTSWKGLKLETPAIYCIRAQGHLNDIWADRLGGMTITAGTVADKPSVTILEGYLSDQAALLGVLNTLYELHLPLLSVEYLEEE